MKLFFFGGGGQGLCVWRRKNSYIQQDQQWSCSSWRITSVPLGVVHNLCSRAAFSFPSYSPPASSLLLPWSGFWIKLQDLNTGWGVETGDFLVFLDLNSVLSIKSSWFFALYTPNPFLASFLAISLFFQYLRITNNFVFDFVSISTNPIQYLTKFVTLVFCSVKIINAMPEQSLMRKFH